MKIIFLILSVMVVGGLVIFCSKREHLLTMLLSLEYIMLSFYFFIMVNMGLVDLFYSLLFIVFTACEGALGLSILVMMSRSHGSDYFKSFNMIN